MAKKKKILSVTVPKPTIEQAEREIKFELRSIIRQRDHLRRPISFFQTIDNVPQDQPRYRVIFDTSSPKPISGLKISSKLIRLPDEKIIDDVLNYAKSIWHLKDGLKSWVKLKSISCDIEKIVSNNMFLMICSDLANRKKHGQSKNRSGVYPKLKEEVEFDTSQNGVLEFYYNGRRKEKELIVSNRVPIPYRVEILKEDGTVFSDNAVMYLTKAFYSFLPVIDKIDFWGNDPESKEIRLLINMR